MSNLKIATLVPWILGAGSFFIATGSQAAFYGRILFWVLAAAHTVECVVFLPRLRRAPGSLGNHLVQTFLFGMVHVSGLPRGEETPGA